MIVLLIVLGIAVGMAGGAWLVHLVRTAGAPDRREQHELELAERTARRAVAEVLTRLR